MLDKLLANLTVAVEPFALCHISPGWRLRLPPPPVPLLHYVLEGAGALTGRTDDRRPIGPSAFAVVPPGVTHALQSGDSVERERRVTAAPPEPGVCTLDAGPPASASLVVACGLVTVRYGPNTNLFDHLPDVLLADLSSEPAVRTAFEGILAEQAGIREGSGALTQALMTQCLVHFFRQVASTGSLPWLDAIGDPRLGRALDRMLDDPSAPHTVDSLATVAAMSRSTFAEKFTAAFSQPPLAMLQHIRMQQAAHLLRHHPDLPIDVVADRCGYSSRSHFSAAFRKHHSKAPTTFRQAH